MSNYKESQENKEQRFSIRLSQSEIEELKVRAQKQGMTTAAYIRKSLFTTDTQALEELKETAEQTRFLANETATNSLDSKDELEKLVNDLKPKEIYSMLNELKTAEIHLMLKRIYDDYVKQFSK